MPPDAVMNKQIDRLTKGYTDRQKNKLMNAQHQSYIPLLSLQEIKRFLLCFHRLPKDR